MAQGKRLMLDFRGLQTIKPTGIELLQRWPEVNMIVAEDGLIVCHLLASHGLADRILEAPDSG